MITSKAAQYGTCPCGGNYENRYVEIRMTVGGKPVILSDVPQGACPNCGSRVYKADVLLRIEIMMSSHNPDIRPNRQ